MKEYNLLANEQPSKRKLILSLKPHAKKIYMKMERIGVQRWSNYNDMWNQDEWKEAKEILKEIFIENGKLICPYCKKSIRGVGTLHHIKYYNKTYLIFYPPICWLVHNKCHEEIHKVGKVIGKIFRLIAGKPKRKRRKRK